MRQVGFLNNVDDASAVYVPGPGTNMFVVFGCINLIANDFPWVSVPINVF
jgi:hypothetical protein